MSVGTTTVRLGQHPVIPSLWEGRAAISGDASGGTATVEVLLPLAFPGLYQLVGIHLLGAPNVTHTLTLKGMFPTDAAWVLTLTAGGRPTLADMADLLANVRVFASRLNADVGLNWQGNNVNLETYAVTAQYARGPWRGQT